MKNYSRYYAQAQIIYSVDRHNLVGVECYNVVYIRKNRKDSAIRNSKEKLFSYTVNDFIHNFYFHLFITF